jgi:hypothetical protein
MPVRVTSAGFNLQDGSRNVLAIAHQPSGATLPGVIGPHDSGFTYLPEEALGPLDRFRPESHGFVNSEGSSAANSRVVGADG